MLSTYLSYTTEQASAMAQKFQGFGPNIFGMRRVEDWGGKIGLNEEEARGVHALVVSMRWKEGAMPEGTQWVGKVK